MTNEQMIAEQVEGRGVRNPRVLAAMRAVDRAHFVPSFVRRETYFDKALPIAHKQTISQPYIVGLMTELLDPQTTDRVLEIGTGTGYQTAILAQLVREVWSLEILPELAKNARARLAELGVTNVQVITQSGWEGLVEHAPYDGIMLTAAPDRIPEMLLPQLAAGGRMVVPLGVGEQDLILLTRSQTGAIKRTSIAPVRFVPMVRKAGE
jgi:protein-L-isoaspartate(D-aspartate) O-methyltransferase